MKTQLTWSPLCLVLLLAFVGCQPLQLRSQSPDEFEDETTAEEEFSTQIETPLVGDYTNVTGLNTIVLQGVGLVTGLDGTGGDPPPSTQRTVLREDMVRRGVQSPNQLLSRPDTALVIIRAYLPPMVQKGDTFDVEVRLPENSNATSLNGGYLMETRLTEHALIPGRGVMKGHDYAIAKGPILVSTGEGAKESSLAGLLQRGRIPGGARSTTERNLALFLRNDYRGFRNSQGITKQIGARFFSYNRHGQREPLAVAKTDQQIELKVHPRYRENHARFLRVVRAIPRRETDVARRLRMQKLEMEMANPQLANRAALKLEAIGEPAIPFLKRVIKNDDLKVQFHAAMALAYLDDPAGIKVLARAAKEEPAMRAFAFATLSTIEDAEAHIQLKQLMQETSAETRYGAFRALNILDKYDPAIAGEDMNGQFSLHLVESDTEPVMIHLSHHKQPEVVLFGAKQKFETPLVVSAGKRIRVMAKPGSESVVVSKYQIGEEDRREEVPRNVADVIRAVVDLGASYPDVVQMLVQAERQHNLEGTIAIDAIPDANRKHIESKVREMKAEAALAKANPSEPSENTDDDDDKQQGVRAASFTFNDEADSGDIKPATRVLTPRKFVLGEKALQFFQPQ